MLVLNKVTRHVKIRRTGLPRYNSEEGPSIVSADLYKCSMPIKKNPFWVTGARVRQPQIISRSEYFYWIKSGRKTIFSLKMIHGLELAAVGCGWNDWFRSKKNSQALNTNRFQGDTKRADSDGQTGAVRTTINVFMHYACMVVWHKVQRRESNPTMEFLKVLISLK